jgi:hypothetical protein
MGVDYWWFGFLITEGDHARIRPLFEVARREAEGTQALHAPAIEAWRANPESYEDGVRTDNHATNAFQAAFLSPGFEALLRSLVMKGGALVDLAREEVVFRFTSIHRSPPVAVLWHALGFDRARALPGHMGNLLIHPRDAARTSKEVDAVYRGLDLDDAFQRGYSFCSGSEFSTGPVNDVVTLLPDGLRRAAELGKGFFAISHKAP